MAINLIQPQETKKHLNQALRNAFGKTIVGTFE